MTSQKHDPTSPQDASPQAPVRPALVESMAVVGLGLMGGSIARATRRASPGTRIIGIDREVILDVAKEEGVIDESASPDETGPAMARADLVVLCLPVMAIIDTLREHADALRDGPVITDIGSTKAAIANAAAELDLKRFVGGHPMAGKSVGGLAHADPELLVGATWFFCPSEETDKEATRLLRQWARSVGASPVEIDAAEHDRAVALTSQLPHILANALAEGVLEEGALDAAGGSLKQMLAVAGAPFDVWRDNLLTNQEPIQAALRTLSERLLNLADALDDTERVRDLFARGRACRERLGVRVAR